MSFSEIVVGLLFAAGLGLMTRGTVRRQQAQEPAAGPTPLLGVVPQPRGEAHVDEVLYRP